MLSTSAAISPLSEPSATSDLALIVDLDGTLTPTDTLVESLVQLVKRRPVALLLLPFWILKGREYLKCKVAESVKFNATNLPLNPELLSYLKEQKARERRIVLATAAHESIANAVAERLPIFDLVLATNSTRNLKGVNKLRAVQEAVGKDFVYAGDSRADLPVWKEARAAVLVGASASVSREAHRITQVEKEFASKPAGLATWIKAIRMHQWTKNVLLFVPLLTGFAFFDAARVAAALLAFVAFSLAASATYLFNDLWDLDSDRAHPRKCQRPFASAALPIQHGIGAAIGMLAVALTLGSFVSGAFLAFLGVYIVLTSAYSWALKEYVLIDVIVLALLYTLRVLAGSVAVRLHVSSWLLAFSVFLFFSLALVKRCSELVSLQQAGRSSASGRDYKVADLTVLWPLGAAASLSAVVVFGLFISAPETATRYATPNLLWLSAVGLLYWVGRLWVKTVRGEMHDDPIVFALKDRGSALTLGALLVAFLAAYFINLPVL